MRVAFWDDVDWNKVPDAPNGKPQCFWMFIERKIDRIDVRAPKKDRNWAETGRRWRQYQWLLKHPRQKAFFEKLHSGG